MLSASSALRIVRNGVGKSFIAPKISPLLQTKNAIRSYCTKETRPIQTWNRSIPSLNLTRRTFTMSSTVAPEPATKDDTKDGSSPVAVETSNAESKDENARKRPAGDEPKDGGKRSKWKKMRAKRDKKGFDKQGKGKWMKDFTDGADKRNEPPHVGSFANPAMREQFGVVIEETKDETKEGEENGPKTNKRKVALFMGFIGTKYGGFQMNPDQRTIQAEVELALYRSGMIAKHNFGTPHKYSWSNSARTDKGVHACAQVCSVKIELPETDWQTTLPQNDRLNGPRELLNSNLPPDIRVLDMMRTTRNFCAKTQRDRVRYQYMVPSFLLHPDWRGAMEQQGIDTTKGRLALDKGNNKTPLTTEEAEKVYAVLRDYRSTEENRNLLQAALDKYQGTRFYHNFTKGLKPGQASAQRFIENFKAQDPVIVDGIEWIPTQVLGQSFLLHQIRKMICVAIDVARGAAPLEFMDKALDKKQSMALHVAPAQGLFLEMSYFGGYNRRKGSQTNHDLSDIDWTKDGPAKDRWSAFRDDVRSHICREDKNQLNFVQYLYLHECVFGCRKLYHPDQEEKTADTTQEETKE